MDESFLTLRKFVAPEFVFGSGARKLVAQYVRNFGGRRVLIVSDPGVAKAGWVGDVAGVLEADGINYAVFDQVTPNPRDHEVAAGTDAYLRADCDLVVAVGGGSPMDCAKGICICAVNGKPIGAHEGVDAVEDPGPPLICIPTTSGSAADVSQFAIITSREQRRKYAIISKAVVPDAALIDPETTVTMDSYLTACTGLDALTHAFEALVSSARSPITDTHAMSAIGLIRSALPRVLADGSDLEARGKMLLACAQAGLAFSNASLGAVHAMAHSLGGFLDLPHGECNALLLPHVVAFNFESASERYVSAAKALDIPVDGRSQAAARKELVVGLIDFARAMGVSAKLSDRGVRSDDIPGLSENSLKDPCLVTNPRRAGLRDVETIFEETL